LIFNAYMAALAGRLFIGIAHHQEAGIFSASIS
jgi:hypothetical protein